MAVLAEPLHARPTLLVVVRDGSLAALLKSNLEQAGFVVLTMSAPAEAERVLRELALTLVVAEEALLEGPGAPLRRALFEAGASRELPSLLLGTRDEPAEGAATVARMARPWSPRVLLHHVRAWLRRRGVLSAVEAPDVLRFGRLELQRGAQRALVDGAEVHLTTLEFRLLETLVERSNRVQTRETLLADVWGLYLSIGSRTVDTHVKRLREKLGPAGAYVHTVRLVGYRFARDPSDLA